MVVEEYNISSQSNPFNLDVSGRIPPSKNRGFGKTLGNILMSMVIILGGALCIPILICTVGWASLIFLNLVTFGLFRNSTGVMVFGIIGVIIITVIFFMFREVMKVWRK